MGENVETSRDRYAVTIAGAFRGEPVYRDDALLARSPGPRSPAAAPNNHHVRIASQRADLKNHRSYILCWFRRKYRLRP